MAGRAIDPFAAHCAELLAPLGAAEARRMFGGYGLYVDGLMIGLIAAEQLYFKADDLTRPRWQAAGGRPFVYLRGKDGTAAATTMGYWTPPDEAIESPSLMLPWARLALEAALRARAAKATKAPRKTTGSAKAAKGRPARRKAGPAV